MKYFLLILTFITGGIPIYKGIKEAYKKSMLARNQAKIREHQIVMFEGIILLIVLSATLTGTGIIQYNDTLKNMTDSIRLEGHFSKIITGLKADTLELHKTNLQLEKTKDTLQKALENNSLKLANRISSSGNELVKKIISTTTNLNSQITGGNAFCVGDVVNMGDGTYELEFKNNFENAIPNLLIKIASYSKIESCPFVIEQDKKIYQLQCVDKYRQQVSSAVYEPNVPHLITGSEQFFTNNNGIGDILIEFISPGYYNFQCYEEILFKLNGNKGGPVRYRILKKQNDKIIELTHFNPKDVELNNVNWNDTFKVNDFDFSYKKF